MDLGCLRKKYSYRCKILRSKECWYAVSRKVFFQSSQGLFQMEWGLEWECKHPSRFWSKKNFWSGLSTRKVLMSLSNFAPINVSVCSFTKSVFQSSRGLVQVEWELELECMHPIRCLNRKNFDVGCLRKTYSFRCQILRSKVCRYAVSWKVFFNVVEDLFKWNEG